MIPICDFSLVDSTLSKLAQAQSFSFNFQFYNATKECVSRKIS